jgi:hypothetical protein
VLKKKIKEMSYKSPWWARWKQEAARVFLFPHVFKTYADLQEGKNLVIPITNN